MRPFRGWGGSIAGCNPQPLTPNPPAESALAPNPQLLAPNLSSPVLQQLVHDLLHPNLWRPASGLAQPGVVAHQDRLVRGAQARRVDAHLHRHAPARAHELDDIAD